MPCWECARVGPSWAFGPMPPACDFKLVTRMAGWCAAENRPLLFTSAENGNSPVALKYNRDGRVCIDGMDVYKYTHVSRSHAIAIRQVRDTTLDIYVDEVGNDIVQVEVLAADGLAVYEANFNQNDGEVKVKDLLDGVRLGLKNANRFYTTGKLKLKLRNQRPITLNKVIVKRRR